MRRALIVIPDDSDDTDRRATESPNDQAADLALRLEDGWYGPIEEHVGMIFEAMIVEEYRDVLRRSGAVVAHHDLLAVSPG